MFKKTKFVYNGIIEKGANSFFKFFSLYLYILGLRRADRENFFHWIGWVKILIQTDCAMTLPLHTQKSRTLFREIRLFCFGYTNRKDERMNRSINENTMYAGNYILCEILKTMQKERIKIERRDIFQAIEFERERQDKLHPMPQFKKGSSTDADILHNYIVTNDYLAILVEEIGEVARCLQGEGVLSEELTHCAAVCVRWLENLK